MDSTDQWNRMLRSAVLVAAIAAAGLASHPANGQAEDESVAGESETSGPATNSALVIRQRHSELSPPIDSMDDLTGPADTGVGQGDIADSDAALLNLTPQDESASSSAIPTDSTPTGSSDFKVAASESLPLGADSGLLDLGGQSEVSSRERNELVGGLVEFSRVGGALAVVVGLLVLVAFVMRRMSGGFASGAGRPSGILQILARYPVARGQSLVLLKIDRHILLVHQTGSSMSTLTELTDPNDVASILAKVEASERGPIGGSFHRMLNKAGESYRNSRTKIETIDLTRPDQSHRFKQSTPGTHIAA